MEKRSDRGRNCWMYGLAQAAVILMLAWGPLLLTEGFPGDPATWGTLALTAVPVLGIGTLLMGAIERWRQRDPEK